MSINCSAFLYLKPQASPQKSCLGIALAMLLDAMTFNLSMYLQRVDTGVILKFTNVIEETGY